MSNSNVNVDDLIKYQHIAKELLIKFGTLENSELVKEKIIIVIIILQALRIIIIILTTIILHK
ncbi:hypothetical protein C922_05062 [Plasmodium inui San Antonio 1]|uniref:Uncharacterized protein n=1 Tax=Plasmodium inui San Antonio 1 TaxID=1237626 RepID=W7AH00_9APIC|nr:hypothetical protein C922_05062 [Plasmodium inui San Antonio 1]EUD64546.1 hypothetical protein C922_05062 [Plasmodium inui San Antonio 1]